MGENPDAVDNRRSRAAYEKQVSIVYFLGIAPGRYKAMLPVFIAGWDANALKARLVFGIPDQPTITPPEM